MRSRLSFWKPGNVDNTYCRNRLHLFYTCRLILLRKQVENCFVYPDTSIQIRPSDPQLRKLPQRRIWMSGVDSFLGRLRGALSVGALQLTLQCCVPRFSSTHSYILVAVNLAQ